jgi:hypothetical protein
MPCREIHRGGGCDRNSSVLVPGLSVHGDRQRFGQRRLSHRGRQDFRAITRLLKRRR